MTRWPRSKTWSLRSRGSRRPLCLGARVPALLLLFVLAADGGSAAISLPNARRPRPPTLVVALPQTSWHALRSADLPQVASLLQSSAVALMPVADPSRSDTGRTWVTLGAGRPAVGAEVRGKALPQGGFVVDASALKLANERAHTAAVPGLLGSWLRALGVGTALIVYPASRQPALPPSVALLMDEEGRVDGGWLYDPAAASPPGDHPDPAELKERLEDAVERFDVILLDLTGMPLGRGLDDAVGAAMEVVRGGHFVLICALSPVYADRERRTMGFIVWHDFGQPTAWDRRLLTSPSTRWPGVVSPADFAQTLLVRRMPAQVQHVGPGGVEGAGRMFHEGMAGRPMKDVVSQGALARLDALDRTLTDRYRLRFTTGKWYLAYGGLVLLSSLAFGLWWPQGLRRLGAAALGAALAPVGMLLAPVVGLERAALHLLVAAAIAAAVALACARARRPAAGLAAAMLLGSAPIVVDVLLGSPLMRRSTFGFGVMSGARFYGIGNEYMGFLAAMVVIGLGALLQTAPHTKWTAAVVGAFLVLVIGAPWWGANWGGAFAAAAGLVALWLAWRRKRWAVSVVVAAVLLAASALIPVALDALRPAAERTHIGANVAAVLGGDVGMFADAVRRKAAMNWGLLATYWPGLLLGIVVVAALAWRLLAAGRPARRALAAQPALAAGIFGALVVALVAMVVNDSGVIAAAAALGIGASALIFVSARPLEAPA